MNYLEKLQSIAAMPTHYADATQKVAMSTTPWGDDKISRKPTTVIQTWYPGIMVCINTLGFAVFAEDTAGLRFDGIHAASSEIDILDTTTATQNDYAKRIMVERPWRFEANIATATAGDEGKPVYVKDNQTVAYSGTANAILVGWVDKVTTAGTPGVVLVNPIYAPLNPVAISNNVLAFSGATGVDQITFPAALADALSFAQGTNIYLTFVTTAGSESTAIKSPAATSVTSNGGSITLTSGAGGATSGTGGAITGTAGAGTGASAAGGPILFTGGAGGSSAGAGGSTSMIGGAGTTTGLGGAFIGTGGAGGNATSGTGAIGGAATVTAGAGGTATTGTGGAGAVASLTSGAGGAASAAAGVGGAGGAGTVTAGVGGASALSTGGAGGLMTLAAGTGGAATGGSGNGGAGGNLILNSGIGGTSSGGSAGVNGLIAIGDTASSCTGIYLGRGAKAALQVALTTTAIGTSQSSTPTSAQLLGGIITQTGATGAGTVTLPTGTALSAACPRTPVAGDTFDCWFINIGGSQTLTITGATGTTVSGTVAITSGKFAIMKFVNTGSNAWNIYCMASA